jgi:hypothetical protein
MSKPTKLQVEMLGATCKRWVCEYISDDNRTVHLRKDKDLLTTTIYEMASMGKWIRTKPVAIEPITLNGHHGDSGYHIVEDIGIIDASQVIRLGAHLLRSAA